MTLLLVFLGVAVLGLTALFVVGRLRPPGEGSGPAPASGFDEPEARLPAVLLPPQPVAEDIARLRFSVGLRGYRMDQVDAVLSRLATALRERDAELAAFRGQDGPR